MPARARASGEGRAPDPEALFRLGEALLSHGYRFVTPTPETHRHVDARACAAGRARARTLREAFGWSRPFEPEALPEPIVALAGAAGVLMEEGPLVRATVRFSTLGARLFVHSSYPTTQRDAVFFGPDTYRFCKFIEAALASAPRAERVVDVGCGAGAGAVVAASHADAVVMADINPAALVFAGVNARLAKIQARAVTVQSDVLDDVDGPFDVVIVNPPYLVDPERRKYRDGGGELGEELAIRMGREALQRLPTGGRLLLYTGAAVVAGVDTFARALPSILRDEVCAWTYDEIDPDVFGEEIAQNDRYAAVERIAAVGLIVTKR